MLKRYLFNLFVSAMELNKKNIVELASERPQASLLDLGCDDGAWSQKLAKQIHARSVAGVEIVEVRAEQARLRNIDARVGNLDEKFPFTENSFDVVHANQVIEHVSDVDNLAAEIFRVLKPGGIAVVSTENGSSWHNIFAAILGWQTFSLSNMSKKMAGVGNPLSLVRNEKIELGSWTHKVIFNYRGLKEFFALHGFEDLKIEGAGYYPFFSSLGRIDVRHSHFITISARKPQSPE